MTFEKIEGLGDSRDGAVGESFNEGLNCGYGHGEVGVRFEDCAVGRDDVECRWRQRAVRSLHCGRFEVHFGGETVCLTVGRERVVVVGWT